MREQRSLIQKDLRTVDALQVGSVGQLRVSSQDVFFQLVRLAERLLAVIAHVQILLQVVCGSLFPSILFIPQRKMLSVLTVSLKRTKIRTTKCWPLLINQLWNKTHRSKAQKPVYLHVALQRWGGGEAAFAYGAFKWFAGAGWEEATNQTNRKYSPFSWDFEQFRGSYLCVLRWILRWSERENAASHSWQLYFLSPAENKIKDEIPRRTS